MKRAAVGKGTHHSPGDSIDSDRRRRRRTTTAVLLLCLVVYNSNCRLVGSGDSIPARLIPFAILNHGTVFADVFGPSPPSNYWFRPARNGRLASIYPIILPILITPLYVPAAIYVAASKPPPGRFMTVSEVMEKLSASIIATLSTLVMLLLLRRLTSETNALLLSVAYAFGTETWTISSQALWLHGAAELFLAVALLLLTLRPRRSTALATGAVCSLLAFNRPPNALFALAIAAAYAIDHRERLWSLTIGALAIALPCLLYNFLTFGNVAGAYGVLAGRRLLQHSDSILVGVAALLASPGKGLFIYSPFLLFAAAAVIPGSDRMTEIPVRMLWLAFAVQVLIYALADWTAGACYGPRFLTDASPFLVLALVPALERFKSRPFRIAFALCVAFAIGVQAIGAFCFPMGASQTLSHEEYWKPTGAQFWRELKAGPAKPVFF